MGSNRMASSTYYCGDCGRRNELRAGIEHA
jgi:hypothetical protein